MFEPVAASAGDGLIRLMGTLAYDGTDFAGWAVQEGQRTVQAEVERALGVVLALPAPPRVTVAGRTDSGVHALGQVIHVDVPMNAVLAALSHQRLPAQTPDWDRLARKINGVLPPDVRMHRIQRAPEHFDARFGGLWRRYRYRVCDDPGAVDPLRRNDTVVWPRRLDDSAMAQAAAELLGLNDYAAYCRYREGSTTIRTLEAFEVGRAADGTIEFVVQADAFCHAMVRSLVGALLAVGEGRRSVDWPAQLLAQRTRAQDVHVAPAHGLTLLAVGYPEDADLAARLQITRAVRPDLV